MMQLSQFLNLGVSDATIEKWGKDIVGFDPKTIRPTGERDDVGQTLQQQFGLLFVQTFIA
jgi:hypothetical protein